MPENKKKSALAMAAMRSGMTVLIDIDAMQNTAPMTPKMFAAVKKPMRKSALKCKLELIFCPN